jgi:hypothetical protein
VTNRRAAATSPSRPTCGASWPNHGPDQSPFCDLLFLLIFLFRQGFVGGRKIERKKEEKD